MAADQYIGKTCPFCQTPIKPGVNVVVCNECEMPHHAECWEANGGCTTFGCKGSPISTQDIAVQPPQPTSQPIEIPVFGNPYVKQERDKYGLLIPAEYPAHFNRDTWSWPAFWVTVPWYCVKGMHNEAWKFLLVCLIPVIGFAVPFWAAIVGYREYSNFINKNTPEQIGASRRTGIGCFVVFIVAIVIYQLFRNQIITGLGF